MIRWIDGYRYFFLRCRCRSRCRCHKKQMMEKMENLLLKILLKWFFFQWGNGAKNIKKKTRTNNQSEKSTRKMKHCGVLYQLEQYRYGFETKTGRIRGRGCDCAILKWKFYWIFGCCFFRMLLWSLLWKYLAKTMTFDDLNFQVFK